MKVQSEVSSQDIPDADLALECLWHPFPPSPPCPSPVTPHGLRGSTHLLHLLLLTIGANALEGLLGVVCISALLLICLLGLGGVEGRDLGAPRSEAPEPNLPSPCWGLWMGWGPPHQGQGFGDPEWRWRRESCSQAPSQWGQCSPARSPGLFRGVVTSNRQQGPENAMHHHDASLCTRGGAIFLLTQ